MGTTVEEEEGEMSGCSSTGAVTGMMLAGCVVKAGGAAGTTRTVTGSTEAA